MCVFLLSCAFSEERRVEVIDFSKEVKFGEFKSLISDFFSESNSARVSIRINNNFEFVYQAPKTDGYSASPWHKELMSREMTLKRKFEVIRFIFIDQKWMIHKNGGNKFLTEKTFKDLELSGKNKKYISILIIDDDEVPFLNLPKFKRIVNLSEERIVFSGE